jgi:hypothetical protein
MIYDVVDWNSRRYIQVVSCRTTCIDGLIVYVLRTVSGPFSLSPQIACESKLRCVQSWRISQIPKIKILAARLDRSCNIIEGTSSRASYPTARSSSKLKILLTSSLRFRLNQHGGYEKFVLLPLGLQSWATAPEWYKTSYVPYILILVTTSQVKTSRTWVAR